MPPSFGHTKTSPFIQRPLHVSSLPELPFNNKCIAMNNLCRTLGNVELTIHQSFFFVAVTAALRAADRCPPFSWPAGSQVASVREQLSDGDQSHPGVGLRSSVLRFLTSSWSRAHCYHGPRCAHCAQLTTRYCTMLPLPSGFWHLHTGFLLVSSCHMCFALPQIIICLKLNQSIKYSINQNDRQSCQQAYRKSPRMGYQS